MLCGACPSFLAVPCHALALRFDNTVDDCQQQIDVCVSQIKPFAMVMHVLASIQEQYQRLIRFFSLWFVKAVLTS